MRATSPTLRTYALIALIAGLFSLHVSVAEARSEHLRWTHPAPGEVSHFQVHTGPSSGSYDSVISNLNLSPDGSGIFHFDIDVPDTESIYLAITAVGTNGIVSPASNEGFRASLPPPPPPPPVSPAAPVLLMISP